MQTDKSHMVPEYNSEYAQSRIRVDALRRSHRCHPELIQGLLLAERLSHSGRAPQLLLSVDSVTEICGFAQCTAWLCPWGVEYVDEAHRAGIRSVPQFLLDKMHNCKRNKFLSSKKIKDLVDDERNAFERIFVRKLAPFDWQASLYKHPLEEIHVIYSGLPESLQKGMPFRVIQNILRCESIRVIEISDCFAKVDYVHHLQQLKNLEMLIGHKPLGGIIGQIELYRSLPRLTHVDFFNGSQLLMEHEHADLMAFIQSRRKTLKHIALYMPTGDDVFEALANCPKLQTFRCHSWGGLTDDDLAAFLSHPNIRRNLRDISVHGRSLSTETFSRLAALKNLRWVNLMGCVRLTSDDLNSILIGNSAHIHDVEVSSCEALGPEIFDGISKCAYLERITLHASVALEDATDAYILAQRRNYEAICIPLRMPRYLRERMLEDSWENFW